MSEQHQFDTFYNLHTSINSTSLIFPVKSEDDLMMMDDRDYREHMLLTTFDDGVLTPSMFDNSFNTIVSTSTAETPIDDLNEDDTTMDILKPFLDSSFVSDASNSMVTTFMDDEDEKDTTSTTTTGSCAQDKTVETDDDDVSLPTMKDILCGQSRTCANHAGNQRFQVVLDTYAKPYDAAKTKQEKMMMTKEIVARIQESGGRFLKYQEGSWVEISDIAARDKTSHALRTKVKSWKRQANNNNSSSLSLSNSKSKTAATAQRRRKTHRRRRSSQDSNNSIDTNASDIATNSFDANNHTSSLIMGELINSQKEIFEIMTTTNNDVHPLLKRNC